MSFTKSYSAAFTSSLLSLFLFAAILLGTNISEAGKVLKVKGRKGIISLDGELASKGDLYYATYKGKRRAILQVIKATDSKAIVVIRKGRAIRGMSTVAKGGVAEPRKRKQSLGDVIGNKRRGKFSLGAVAGIGIDSQDVVLQDNSGDGETLEMTGSGYSVKVVADYLISTSFAIRALVGIEQFNVYGTAETNLCDDLTTKDCSSELSFITLDALVKWNYLKGDYVGWLGVGAGLLAPASSNTNALDSESVGTTTAIYLATGFDIALSKTMFIPLQVDYAILPTSSDVSTSIIGLRAGLMFRF